MMEIETVKLSLVETINATSLTPSVGSWRVMQRKPLSI